MREENFVPVHIFRECGCIMGLGDIRHHGANHYLLSGSCHRDPYPIASAVPAHVVMLMPCFIAGLYSLQELSETLFVFIFRRTMQLIAFRRADIFSRSVVYG